MKHIVNNCKEFEDKVKSIGGEYSIVTTNYDGNKTIYNVKIDILNGADEFILWVTGNDSIEIVTIGKFKYFAVENDEDLIKGLFVFIDKLTQTPKTI